MPRSKSQSHEIEKSPIDRTKSNRHHGRIRRLINRQGTQVLGNDKVLSGKCRGANVLAFYFREGLMCSPTFWGVANVLPLIFGKGKCPGAMAVPREVYPCLLTDISGHHIILQTPALNPPLHSLPTHQSGRPHVCLSAHVPPRGRWLRAVTTFTCWLKRLPVRATLRHSINAVVEKGSHFINSKMTNAFEVPRRSALACGRQPLKYALVRPFLRPSFWICSTFQPLNTTPASWRRQIANKPISVFLHFT